MAYQRTSTSNGFASPSASVSSTASGSAASPRIFTFSIFQEGPGRPLIFAPPRGTPELQSLIDLFIAVEVPVSMKMELIQRDFETHAARTNERYKTYTVSAPAAPATPALTTSPSTFSASPSPRFHGVFDSQLNHQASFSGRNGSGSEGSLSLDTSPAPRPSPAESVTAASDVMLPLSAPMFPMIDFTTISDYSPLNPGPGLTGNVFPVARDVTAASSWPSTTLIATSTAQPSMPSAPKQQKRRRLSGSSSMQILTRTGEDVTHLSSRGTRTHEERENTRLVRQRGACPDCRRKKTRCNPDHAGSSLRRTDSARAGPYVPSVQSGRAKADAETVKAAKARKEKIEGKKAAVATMPVSIIPQAPNPAILAGIEDWGGGGGGFGDASQCDLGLFQDSFDWDQLTAGQSQPLTDEDFELSIAASLSMTMPASTLGTTVSETVPSVQTGSSSIPLSLPTFPSNDTGFPHGHNILATSSAMTTTGYAPRLESLIDTTGNLGDVSTDFALASNADDVSFSDPARFYSAVNASMVQSCVQLSSAETEGLILSSGPRTSISPSGSNVQGMNEGDSRRIERHGTISVPNGVEPVEECESEELHVDTNDHGTVSPSLLLLPPSIDEGESSSMWIGVEKTRPPNATSTRTQSFLNELSRRIENVSASSTVASCCSEPATVSLVSQALSPSPSSASASYLSPMTAAALLVVFSGVVESLIPAFLTWKTVSQVKDRSAFELESKLAQMCLNPAPVACQ
ncbi:hypothetical protein SEPCBS57363_000686 [Sporothrix epigloea]|uniref:Zn(2)-C6 fungal-type domain-containing protein n=1 Tax=Sporothrix epigloea TaxID=1892477 RepID=A0ABP0D7Q4_9PEZI